MKKFFKFTQFAQWLLLSISTFVIIAGVAIYICCDVNLKVMEVILKSACAVFGIGLFLKVISIYGLKLREATKFEPKVIAKSLWCAVCILSMFLFFMMALESFIANSILETILHMVVYSTVFVIFCYAVLGGYCTGKWIIKYL